MRTSNRTFYIIVAGVCFSLLLLMTFLAPELPSSIEPKRASLSPWEFPPLGTDMNGRPLWEYATQGAKIIALPSLLAGVLVAIFGMGGGLLRCLEMPKLQALVQFLGEIVGALPRMVVVLVVALLLPRDWRSLEPLAIVWAILSAPSAIDEAGAVASRIGGSRFVEALRAHGFSSWRIYIQHIVLLNLRPVIVRQGAETMMTVAFLEVALSYLAVVEDQASFTHPENLRSWADLLKEGYLWLALGLPTGHVLFVGLFMLGFIVVAAMSLSKAAEAR